MSTLATVADLEVRLGVGPGTLAGPDLVRAQAALDDASVLIRAEAGRTFEDANGVVVAPAPVVVVATQVALRVYRNPDGFVSESYGGDYAWQGPQGLSAFLTDEEKRVIRLAVSKIAGGWSGTGTVRTPSGYATDQPALPFWWE